MQLPGWKGIFWRKDPDPFHAAIYDAVWPQAPRDAFAGTVLGEQRRAGC